LTTVAAVRQRVCTASDGHGQTDEHGAYHDKSNGLFGIHVGRSSDNSGNV